MSGVDSGVITHKHFGLELNLGIHLYEKSKVGKDLILVFEKSMRLVSHYMVEDTLEKKNGIILF